MSQPSARPRAIVHSIATRFGTGREPGCARQTVQVCVFGGSPKDSSQRQNIFVRVFSWTWISRPTTVSQLDIGCDLPSLGAPALTPPPLGGDHLVLWMLLDFPFWLEIRALMQHAV